MERRKRTKKPTTTRGGDGDGGCCAIITEHRLSRPDGVENLWPDERGEMRIWLRKIGPGCERVDGQFSDESSVFVTKSASV